ncbi:hypothetical protein Tco_0419463, partial [Tanacetum coccineum]
PKDKRVKQTGKMTGSGKQKQLATGDGVDIMSKVPDEQVHEKIGTNKGVDDDANKDSDVHDDEDDEANKDSDAHDDDDNATESDDDG